jgi:hypothetical protein
VQRYGIESWDDPDYVCIYGLRPVDWYDRGIRILGRTTVECTRDELADKIGSDIAVTEIVFSWWSKRMYGLNAPGQKRCEPAT